MGKLTNIPTQKIDAAARGEQSATKEVLYALAKNIVLQNQVTSTQTKNAPPQAASTVSALKGNYIVQILRPGAQTPSSALQATQAAKAQTQTSVVQNITPVYHQIQAAQSPRFDAGSNVTTFGGDNGSTQTYWTITSLGAGQWYFRIRSSYDGTNWNLWRNSNGGKALNGRAESVTAETVLNGVAAVFQLPGTEVVSFIAGLVDDGGSFTLPENLFTSAMQAISGPNGFRNTGHPSHGIKLCDIAIADPGTSAGLIGPPDFPTVVGMQYGDNSGNTWFGSANFLAFAYDPLGNNVAQYAVPQGNWAIFTLPGGAQLAVGSGFQTDGGSFALPPGFSSSNMQAIASPKTGFSAPNDAHGVFACSITGTTVAMQFKDGSGNVWSGDAHWFAVVYSPGLRIDTGFLILQTPGGSLVAIGSGTGPSFSAIPLPPGFSFAQSLIMTSPATFNDAGHPMHGVAQCSANNGLLNLSYQDGEGNSWDGNVNWFCFAWQ